MGSTNHLFVMLLAVLCSIALSSDAEKSTIELSVDLSVPVASLPDRYLSVAIDSAQVCWKGFCAQCVCLRKVRRGGEPVQMRIVLSQPTE